MIHAGTDLKYKVTAQMLGFDIDEDDMELVIKNRWGQVKYSYTAEDFISDGKGGWYFVMPDVKRGTYYAYLSCYRGDDDMDYRYQRVTDKQKLCDIDICQCEGSCDCECGCHVTDGLDVHYERVWTVSFIDGIYLADCNGNPILDVNGNPIRFDADTEQTKKDARMNMTAEEFMMLIEGRNDNGKVDTVPEALDTLRDVGEGTEMSVVTNEDVDDMMNRILNGGGR